MNKLQMGWATVQLWLALLWTRVTPEDAVLVVGLGLVLVWAFSG